MGLGRRFMQVLGHPVLHLALHMQMQESVSLSFPIAIDIVYGLQDLRGYNASIKCECIDHFLIFSLKVGFQLD